MAPGYEWRTLWDSIPVPEKSIIPDEHVASVEYDWDTPQKHEAYEVRFDSRSLLGTAWLGEASIEDSLQEIAESIKGVPSDELVREFLNTVTEGPLQELALSVKDIAKTLEKQAKAKRY